MADTLEASASPSATPAPNQYLRRARRRIAGDEEQRCRTPQYDRHIGRHQRAVGDDVGVKGVEEQCQEASLWPEEIGGPAKDDRAQEQRHQDDGEAGTPAPAAGGADIARRQRR